MTKRINFLIILLLLPLLIFSQRKSALKDNENKINFSKYSFFFEKIHFDGYTNSTGNILSLLQTRDGYIWLGTSSGLYRYDGYHINVFNKNDNNELNSNTINCLFEDKSGIIWIGTDNGLSIYDKKQAHPFREFKELRGSKISTICEDKNGIILTGSNDGLNQIKNFTVTKIKNNGKSHVSKIIKDSSGYIWVSYLDDGIYKYESGIFKHITLPSETNSICELSCDIKGNIWAGSVSGSIFRLNASDGSQSYSAVISPNTPISRIIGLDDDVWVSTLGKGLYSLKNGIINYHGKEFGLYHDMIISILSDNENNIWVGTIGAGLFKIRRDKVIVFTEKNGLSTNFNNTIFQDSKNNIWIGSSYSGVDRISSDNKITRFNSLTGLPESKINTICEDADGIIWIGTENKGISIINGNKVEPYYNDKISGKAIKVIFRDSKNNLWIGTNNGLLKLSKDNQILYNVDSRLPHAQINCISEDNKNNIIIGTYRGISIFDGNIFTNYNTSSSSAKMINDHVNCIYCDKEGIIWVGTEQGISRIRNGEIDNYDSKIGLFDNNIMQIIEDNNILWISSKRGIFYVKKNSFLTNNTDDKFLLSVGYNAEDGMLASECSGVSQPAGIKANNGYILFSTIYGICAVNPKHIFSNITMTPPNVVISEFKVDNISAKLNGEIILKPGKKSFQFDFSALSFSNPEKNQYRYMLEGYDDTWQYAGNKTHVEYTNLAPGDYTFRVMASNSDGVWNVEGAALSFTLKPYFYQTMVFYSLLIIAGFIILFLFVQWRVRNLERRKYELEKIVDIRTRELKEINQTKDKLFSIISHDLRGSIGNFMSMLKLLVDEPDSVDETDLRDILKTMKVSSESTYYLLDNLLNWARSQRGVIEYNPAKMEIKYIADDVIHLLGQIAKSKGINLRSDIASGVEAFFDKSTVNTVIRNLVSNALKFTKQNGNVWLSAEESDNKIIVSVNDDGVGISQENIDKIFKAFQGVTTLGTSGEKGTGLGLLLCKEFVEKNGGKIWVESQIGKGSSFKFSLPIE